MSTIINLLLSFSLAYIINRILIARKQSKLYPPGPKGLPFVGNALNFPTADNAQEYVKWEKKYGSRILHASAFGTHIIILNDQKIADDLLERRAVKYSDRPYWPTAELTGMDLYNLGVIRYGERWRLCRKIFQQVFRQAVTAKNFHPTITAKVHQALRGLLHSPERFADHSKMLSVSIPMSTMYGYEVESFEDPCVVASDESFMLSIELLAPGGSIINVAPILRFLPPWFPGLSSRKKAAKARELTNEMLRIPLDFVKLQMSKGIATPSLVSNFFEKKATSGASEEEEEAVLTVAPTAYAGGSDTTISATGTFMYLMAVNPEVQEKAQAEIDRVIGSKRLPTFADRQAIPYIEAIYQEILRWRPPVQLGVPHAITEDDFYEGYLLPKGATVVTNIWAMTHDETVYPDPMSFKPERYLKDDGSLIQEDRMLAFGFGRRICAGRHVASATLWLTIASTLAVFKFEHARDEAGRAIEIKNEYEDFGLVTHKKPFKCSITPRSRGAQQLIEQTDA